MHDLRLRRIESVVVGTQPAAVAEGELRAFVGRVITLRGSNQAKFLEDNWLNESAEMERMPEPSNSEWQLVTLVPSGRLIWSRTGRAPLSTGEQVVPCTRQFE